MTVEINHSSPSEIYRVALSSPTKGHWSSRTRPRELEKARVGDDEDLALVVSPPPSRWPRIFPSL